MSISIPYCFNLWYCLIYSNISGNTLILTSLESYVQWNWLARTNVVFWVDWNVMWQREKWIIFTVRAKPEEFLRIIGNKGTVRTAINFCRTEKKLWSEEKWKRKGPNLSKHPPSFDHVRSVGPFCRGVDGRRGRKRKNFKLKIKMN